MSARRGFAAIVGVVVCIAACRGDEGKTADAAAAGSAPGAATGATTGGGDTTAAPGKPECPQDVAWQPCSLEKRLTDAGFVPVKEESPAEEGVFPVAGTAYKLGPAELHVYLFPSAEARERAVQAIDTVAVARRGASRPWSTTPVLISANNLAAVLLSENPRLIERVQLALTAGLPPPSR